MKIEFPLKIIVIRKGFFLHVFVNPFAQPISGVEVHKYIKQCNQVFVSIFFNLDTQSCIKTKSKGNVCKILVNILMNFFKIGLSYFEVYVLCNILAYCLIVKTPKSS